MEAGFGSNWSWVNLRMSTDAVRVSRSITRPGFGRLKVHVSLRHLHSLPSPCLITALHLPSQPPRSPQSQIHPTNAPVNWRGTTHSGEVLLASFQKPQKGTGTTLDQRTSLSASLRLPLPSRLSLRNGAAANTAFTVRVPSASRCSALYAARSDIYRRK